MNIFILSSDIHQSVESHCDQHLNSQIKEAAQILSTVAAIHCNDGKKISHLYEPTHANHPCTIWAATNYHNAEYTCRYAKLLNLERIARFNSKTDHDSVRVAQNALIHIVHFMHIISDDFKNATEMTPFAEAMPEYIKRMPYPMTTVSKYHLVYKMKQVEWSTRLENPITMSWTGRPIPRFMYS